VVDVDELDEGSCSGGDNGGVTG